MIEESRQFGAGLMLQEDEGAMRLNQTVYMDYQATTPIDPAVLAEMDASFRADFANPHSVEHILGWSAAATVEQAAATIGDFVGASADSVVFTSGATEANWLAIMGVAAQKSSSRRRILLSAAEHKSIVAACAAARDQFACELTILDVDREGCVSLDELAHRIADDVLLVSVMAVNNEVGALNSIAKLAPIVANAGALFHVDASQAPSALDMDEFAQHTDLITLSAHKVYGPKGIGALIATPTLQSLMEPIMRGGGQQGGLRPGTVPVPLCVGFAAALREINKQGESERIRVAGLRDRLVAGLDKACGGVELVGPPAAMRHPGNACVRIHGIDGPDLIGALQPRLAASTQSACNSGSMDPSPVLLAMGLEEEAARECVRFSVGRFSCDDQIDDAVTWVSDLVHQRRRLSGYGSGAPRG